MTDPIRCPKCGKVCGEWPDDRLEFSRAGVTVYGPICRRAVEITCRNPKCGYTFDLVDLEKGLTKA